MEDTALKNIDKKYIDMVDRFRAIPNDRRHTAERIKMILFRFDPWYKEHRDELSAEEREYLQSNIHRVEDKGEIEKEKPKSDIKEWWEE